MNHSRGSDDMLDGMKSLADRLIREKQKAHDMAELYRFKLHESETLRQQADEEIFSNHKLMAHQRVKIQEGDTFLQNLQDKVRVSDVYQETLHKEISVLEEVLQQMSDEFATLEESFSKQFGTFQEDIMRSTKLIEGLQQEIARLASLEESLRLDLKAEKEQQRALEVCITQRDEKSSNEKAQYESQLAKCKEEITTLQTSIQQQAESTANEKAKLEQIASQQISALQKGLADMQEEFRSQQETMQSSLRTSEENAGQIQAALNGELEALKADKELLQSEAEAAAQSHRQVLSEKEREASELAAKISAAETESMQQKEEYEKLLEAGSQACADLRAEADLKENMYNTVKESYASLETTCQNNQAEAERQRTVLHEEIAKSTGLLWSEKDRIKKLQDEFAEQYEKLGKSHVKEIKTLQQKIDEQQQQISQALDVNEKQSSNLRNLEASISKLESAKIGEAAVHKAKVAEVQKQLQDLKVQEQEHSVAHEHKLEAMKASLEAQTSSGRELTAKMELQHSKALSDLQSDHKEQIAELNLRLQELNRLKDESAQKLDRMREQINAEDEKHKMAMENMQEAIDKSLQAAAEEKTYLEQQAEEKDDQLDSIAKQLNDREESLEAMRSQARKREQLIATLQDTLEEKEQLLNCISAAATQKKVSPKVKSGYPSPAMQAAALYEQEQQMRKKAYKKRKLQGLEGSSKPMAMHAPDQIRRQQQAKQAASKGMHGARRSGRSKFSSMSAEPANFQEVIPACTAIGLFGTEIAIPYE